jgi:L,D-peptidoglycan transpeptidase YkuD (ErfK/YbiS/YcfS/YnhG family)
MLKTKKRMQSPARIFLILLACIASINVSAFQSTVLDSITSFSIPSRTNQVIIVTSSNWATTQGRLQRFERIQGKWTKVSENIPVALGKNGLAWGKGLHKNDSQPQKKEGDSEAPAGIFSLGTMFGYASQSPSHYGYPYRQSTVRDYFVDDVNSTDYNKWVTIPPDKENNPKAYWASVEKMKRGDHLYEYGVIINHNVDPIEKGKGSAIFFHVWRTPGAATLGCTSMSKENLLQLMAWLDPKKEPLLIQVPVSELARVN